MPQNKDDLFREDFVQFKSEVREDLRSIERRLEKLEEGMARLMGGVTAYKVIYYGLLATLGLVIAIIK